MHIGGHPYRGHAHGDMLIGGHVLRRCSGGMLASQDGHDGLIAASGGNEGGRERARARESE